MKKYLLTILVAILCVVLCAGVLTACQDTKYTVTYLGGVGATGTAPTEADHVEGDVFKLAQNSFTKDGYTFNGWNDGTKTYAAGADYTMPAANVTLTAQWKKDEPKPEPVENELAGMAFYSFSANAYCEFTDEVDADGYYQVIFAQKQGTSTWVGNLNTVRYSVSTEYVAEVKQGDNWVELFSIDDVSVNNLEVDGNVYYKVGAKHSVTVAEAKGDATNNVTLVYNLGVTVTLNRTPDAKEELTGYATVNHEIDVVSYDGHEASSASYTFISNELTLMYVVDETTYQAVVNLGDNTSVLTAYGVVLTAEATIDGQQYTFRANFVDKMSDEGYRTLASFEVLENDEYRQILSSSVNRSNPDGQGYTYVFSEQVGNVKTTYTVRYVEATGEADATFEVAAVREVLPTTLTVYTSDNQYKAMFDYTDNVNDVQLVYLGKLIEATGEYNTIYTSLSLWYNSVCGQVTTNIFAISSSSDTYRVDYVPASGSDEAQLVVDIVEADSENHLAGTKYYNFSDQIAWDFGSTADESGHYSITQFEYLYSVLVSETDVYYTYTYGIYAICAKNGNLLAIFYSVEDTITTNNAVYYSAGVSHTFTVKEDGEDKQLKMSFTLSLSAGFYFNSMYVYCTVTEYDGREVTLATDYTLSNGSVVLQYEKDSMNYRVTVVMTKLTSSTALYSTILYSGEQYKAEFSEPTSTGFNKISFYRKNNENWVIVGYANTSSTSENLWKLNGITVGNVTPSYEVRYYPAEGSEPAYFTVSVLNQVVVEKTQYRATFEVDEEVNVTLLKLEYKSNNYFYTAYDAKYPSSYGTVEVLENKQFRVTYGVLSVTVMFVADAGGDVSKSDFTYDDGMEEPEPGEDNLLAGNKYVEWTTKTIWVFSSKVGEDQHYVIKQYTYSGSAISMSEAVLYYTIEGSQYKIFSADGNELATLDGVQDTISADGKTYYKTGVTHSLTVKEKSGETEVSKVFVVKFDLTVSVSNVYSISFTGSDYSYDGISATQVTGYTLSNDNWVVEYENNSSKYRATITMSKLESSVALYSTIIYLDDQYKAEFTGGTASGFTNLTFYVKNGDAWTQIGYSGNSSTNNTWKLKGNQVDNIRPIYLVTYVPAHDDEAATITVDLIKEVEIVIDNESGHFTANFEIDADGKVTLTYLYDEEEWTTVFSASVGSMERLGEYTFYVELHNFWGDYELTITYVPGSADDFSDATFTVQQGKVTPAE